MNEKDRIKEMLKMYFEKNREIKAAYLYGSLASSREHRGSDIDIAILTGPFRDRMESFMARVRLQAEISRAIGRDVDLVFLQETGELLSFQIFKTGEVIFENDKDTHRRFMASRLIRCIDFQFYQKRMQKGLVRAMRKEAVGK